MSTPRYPKLARDKIPVLIQQEGKVTHTHKASGKELEIALWNKLEEEIQELQESPNQEEFADVMEVLHALGAQYGIPPKLMEQKRKEKATQRGNFSQGIILDAVEPQKKPITNQQRAGSAPTPTINGGV